MSMRENEQSSHTFNLFSRNFDAIPSDILLQVLLFLEIQDIVSFGQVSKTLKGVSENVKVFDLTPFQRNEFSLNFIKGIQTITTVKDNSISQSSLTLSFSLFVYGFIEILSSLHNNAHTWKIPCDHYLCDEKVIRLLEKKFRGDESANKYGIKHLTLIQTEKLLRWSYAPSFHLGFTSAPFLLLLKKYQPRLLSLIFDNQSFWLAEDILDITLCQQIKCLCIPFVNQVLFFFLFLLLFFFCCIVYILRVYVCKFYPKFHPTAKVKSLTIFGERASMGQFISFSIMNIDNNKHIYGSTLQHLQLHRQQFAFDIDDLLYMIHSNCEQLITLQIHFCRFIKSTFNTLSDEIKDDSISLLQKS
ncbi:hypothetical protein RFI_10500, partial [Reticulomyxa filosa]